MRSLVPRILRPSDGSLSVPSDTTFRTLKSLVVPEDGVWQFSTRFQTQTASATGTRSFRIDRNGSGIAFTEATPGGAGNTQPFVTTAYVRCSAGDRIDFGGFQNSGAAMTLAATLISAVKVAD